MLFDLHNKSIVYCGIIVNCIIIGLAGLFQICFVRRLEFGDCGNGVWFLSSAVVAVLSIGAVSNAVLAVISEFKKKNKIFYLCIVAFILVFAAILSWFVTWIIVALVLAAYLYKTKSMYVFYLFLLISLIFHIEAFVRLSTNHRRLRDVQISQQNIETAANLSRRYIEERVKALPQAPEWSEGLSQFFEKEMGESSYNRILSKEMVSNYCYNKALIGVDFTNINPDAVFIFDRPFESSDILENLDFIKDSEKKYLWLISYKGDLYRYIPSRNERIPIKCR